MFIKGFDRFSKYNFNANIGTTIYGIFNFKEGKKFQSIRHVIRPSVSYGINPSFEKYYDEYKPKEFKNREIAKTRKKYIEFAIGTILVGLIIYLYKK